ncbi:hypothetical protein ABIB73_003846 [Bradyrhizobium sp. F1.4.3]|uniref:hypothetical protein n=1 Tax=Bradyrhizobium sp. F1.4.3 TaxID=3156356 RepID=UPI00339B35F2
MRDDAIVPVFCPTGQTLSKMQRSGFAEMKSLRAMPAAWPCSARRFDPRVVRRVERRRRCRNRENLAADRSMAVLRCHRVDHRNPESSFARAPSDVSCRPSRQRGVPKSRQSVAAFVPTAGIVLHLSDTAVVTSNSERRERE